MESCKEDRVPIYPTLLFPIDTLIMVFITVIINMDTVY